MTTKDAHTEHCCWCGCQYGNLDCPVAYGKKQPSYPCSECLQDDVAEEIKTQPTPGCGFWTEHDATQNSSWEHPPVSAEVSALGPGTMLIGTSGEGAHFVLREVGTYEHCKASLDRSHEIGWDAWLAEWKLKHGKT